MYWGVKGRLQLPAFDEAVSKKEMPSRGHSEALASDVHRLVQANALPK